MQRLRPILVGASALFILNSAYLLLFDTPSIFYLLNVLVHVLLGVALFIPLLLLLGRAWKGSSRATERLLLGTGIALFLTGVLTGIYLVIYGATSAHRAAWWGHVVLGAGALAILYLFLYARVRGGGASEMEFRAWRAAGWTAAVIVVPLLWAGVVALRSSVTYDIRNPGLPALSPDVEGGGRDNPFFPSSAQSARIRKIPADFFLGSETCGTAGCHPDLYKQWNSSAHHRASFNNQWYRKSVEYMQAVIGPQPSKWCGGCHDHAVLFSGQMETPIQDRVLTPEAQAGLACVSCHSIVHVKDTMGQGGFVIEYPELHKLGANKNPYIRKLHDFLVRLDPEPHKKSFMKPFHRQQTAEFCSSCHKVHLDKPVNHYRWFRGFNDYDAWQGSGMSGQGARAFYHPDAPKKCVDCHMPLIRSNDMGNVNGYVHSHRFLAANTALPVAYRDEEQLKATVDFLKSGFLTVDIFAATPLPAGSAEAPAGAAPLAEERADYAGTRAEDEPRPVIPGAGGAPVAPPWSAIAPLDKAVVTLPRGGTLRLDVVARTRAIGHNFPGGTIDAFDVWLELKAEDERGRILYWSGWVEDEGRGPVEKSAHFYRSLLLDARGNPINKRNAWAARAILYARSIPPGAADVGHFLVRIPPDAGERIKLTARMNYRKFAWWNTQWAYAGVRDPAQTSFALSPDYDDGRWLFVGDLRRVSGVLKEIPNLPIVTVAEKILELPVGDRLQRKPTVVLSAGSDRERFNDYGIGLLLQRDFRGALAAFQRVIEIDPKYADGYVNVARARLEEGNVSGAEEMLKKALELKPELAKAHFFYAMVRKAYGDYDRAIHHLARALSQYPRDRVIRNQMGRIFYLQRRYDEAIAQFQETLRIEPEDLQAHYNLMLCYRGKGDSEMARKEETLYLRFKDDESAQQITLRYRLAHPEDNRERQLIHDHPSAWRP